MQHLAKLSEPGVSSLFPEPEFGVQLREDLALADVRMVLGLFAGDLQRLTASLRIAADAGQVLAFRRAAHALAGAAGAVGANVLERTCRVSMSAVNEDAAGLISQIANIEAAATAAELAMERINAELVLETASPAEGRA